VSRNNLVCTLRVVSIGEYSVSWLDRFARVFIFGFELGLFWLCFFVDRCFWVVRGDNWVCFA